MNMCRSRSGSNQSEALSMKFPTPIDNLKVLRRRRAKGQIFRSCNLIALQLAQGEKGLSLLALQWAQGAKGLSLLVLQ